MELILYLILLFAIGFFLYKFGKRKENELTEQYMNTIHVDLIKDGESSSLQPMHFDLLDENGDPVHEDAPHPETSENSDAQVQELQYFCIKDKGYHVSVWPKDHSQFDIVEFNIAGISHRDKIDNYLGEFTGYLEAEPTNKYDSNAIKVLAYDSHHIGYVPKDMTVEIRKEVTLPCPCFCYIGRNDDIYFSDCYILRK